MAAIDYYGIETQLQSILQAASSLSGVMVTVEEGFEFGLADVGKSVGIYLDQRNPTQDQPLAAGQQTRFLVQLKLWCVAFSAESIAKACELRDSLIGAVELVLMQNRTIGGKVSTSWLAGGEFFSARNPNSGQLMAGGEIVLICDATAKTV